MDLCIYCGAIATERDHLYPRARRAVQPRTRGYYKRGLNHDGSQHYDRTVPACSKCNRALRDYPDPDIRQRAAFLVEKWKDRGLDPARRKWLRAVALLDLEDDATTHRNEIDWWPV